MKHDRVYGRMGTAFTALLALSLHGGLAYGADAPDISGIYWATQYNAKIQIVGGGELPLTAKGKAAYDKNIAGLKDGSLTDGAPREFGAGGVAPGLGTPLLFQ